MVNKKLILLLQERNMLNNDDSQEMVVHVEHTFEIDDKTYVPVINDGKTTICRVDIVDGNQTLTDDLSDEEYQRVQVCYNTIHLQHG